MTRVILDETLREKLPDLTEQIEFYDETGRTVAHCIPAELYNHLMITLANAHVTDEELDRASQEPGGRTLAEIWARLGVS